MDNNNQSGYNSSSFSNEQAKIERKEATEKVGQIGARAAADYFTGGAYEKVRNIPVAGNLAQGAEKVVGKAANVADKVTFGALGKNAAKLNKVGVLDKANQAVGMVSASKVNGNSDVLNKSTAKNINPNPEAINHSNTIDPESDKKGISFAPIKNEDNKDSDIDTDNSGESSLITDKDVIKKPNPIIGLGCLILVLLTFAMSIPLIVLSGGISTTDVMKNVDCRINESDDCEVDDSGGFFSKFKNLLKYGSFASNSEVLSKKVEGLYTNIYNTYEVNINVPLLVSTLTADLTMEEVNTTSNNVISDEVLRRMDYAEELAMMQFEISDVIYKCNEKEVDDRTEYYVRVATEEELRLNKIDPLTVKFHKCNKEHADDYIKVVEQVYDEKKYFEKLENSVILKALFPEYTTNEEDKEKILLKLHQQNTLYEYLYGAQDVGTIPVQLFQDENVMLSRPMKGRIYVTSPFGYREGAFSGFHKGIDLVSNDKTIYSAGIGVVTRANFETMGGNVVEITHTDSSGEKYITQYAHLSQILVSVGEQVSTGDVVGIMGATGMVTGPHLHFQMWKVSPYELYNPRNLLMGDD